MKQYLFTVLALAFLMTACDKTGITGLQDSGEEISFSSYLQRSVTKADPVTYDKDITVSSLFGTGDAEVGSPYFSNAVFKCTAGVYGSNPSIYWPFDMYGVPRKLDFFAVGSKDNSTSITASSAVPTLQLSNLSGDNDIVTAFVAGQSHSLTPVPLQFGHTLTKLSFKLKSADNSIRYVIKNVYLKANSSATYSFKTNSSSASWTAATLAKTYSVQSSEVQIARLATEPVALTTELMLLPLQPATANTVVVSVEYEAYYYSEAETEIAVFKGTKAADLTDSASDDWGINKSVIYTLELSAGKAITFTSEQSDWTGPFDIDAELN